METSIFAAWLERYFAGIVLRITARYNDEKLLPVYLFKKFLKKDFSVDGKWESININNQLVAADIIAMDSSIPLKNRASMGRASGDIPKMGLELALREKQLTDLQTLIARKTADSIIVAKIFQDTPLVIGGQYERLELMFLEGFSTGLVEVTDSETVGAAVRLNYGYLPENRFESSTSFDDPAATPFTDLTPLLDKAAGDGNKLIAAFLDRQTFNNICKSQEGKDIYAAAFGIFGAAVPTPTLEQMNNAMQARYGFQFELIERSVKVQRNGVNTTIVPWKAGQIVFVTTLDLGSYVYARLAEQDHPVAGVNYQLVDDFILVSKFRTNRPSLAEFTNSQSRVVPVIDNTEAIYTMDSTVDNG